MKTTTPKPHPIVRERIEKARREGCRHVGPGVLLGRQDRRLLGVPEDEWSHAATFCCWCGKSPVPRGRRTWCGNDCVTAYKILSDPRYVRTLVEHRDRGVCAVCGINCIEIEALMRRCRTLNRAAGRPWGSEEERNAWGPWWTRNHTLWEADHVVPVTEGGGCCGLENYRTLCVRCHKAETAQLAARLGPRRAARNARGRELLRRIRERESGQQQLPLEESA